MLGALARVVDRWQGDLADRFAPEVGVVPKVQLLQFDHQATQVHAADARTFAQHPVVTQDLGDQRTALNREILLITLLGVEARDHVIGADKQQALRTQMLAEAILRQVARLFTQHPVNHVGQRFVAQDLTCLSHQLIVQRVDKRLLEQAFEVGIQSVLHSGVAGITLGPLGGNPILEPRTVATVFHVQHQVCAQAVEQAFAVLHVGADLPFQQRCDLR